MHEALFEAGDHARGAEAVDPGHLLRLRLGVRDRGRGYVRGSLSTWSGAWPGPITRRLLAATIPSET